MSVSHKQKSIMLLYSRGYSYNDISKILGMTPRQVRYGLSSLKTNREVYELLYYKGWDYEC